MDESTVRRLRMLEFQTESDEYTVSSSASSLPHQQLQVQQRENSQGQSLALLRRNLVDTAGNVLNTADRKLWQLQQDDTNMLGSALLRGCTELADAVSHVAAQLENQTDAERRALATACLEDFSDPHSASSSVIFVPSEKRDDELDHFGSKEGRHPPHPHEAVAVSSPDTMTVDALHSAIGGAAVLLRDVESALRSLQADEAEELADAALGVAHFFIATLQHLHFQLLTAEQKASAPQQQGRSASSFYQESPNITILSDDDDDDGNVSKTKKSGSDSSQQQKQGPFKHSFSQPQRVRCLWPPVGPAVGKVLHWSQEELKRQHWLLTAALGMTLWPVLAVAAVFGSGALLVDHGLQTLYQRLEGRSLITAAEVAAAQLYQTSRLAWLTTRTVARPTLKVARRQLQRHAPAVREWCVYRLQHPVELVRETICGVGWCTEQLIGLISHQLHEWQQQQEQQRNESTVHVDLERHRSVQELQL